MADYKIQGEASLDITKAEQGLTKLEQGATKATQAIQRESQKASKAAEGMGDGINVGAQKFTRAESQISASIKRATTQLELLGKTASQKIEFRINERGIDASKFEPALRKLRELEEAQRRVNNETSRFEGLAAGAAGAVGGFAAALAGSFSVRQFIEAADAVSQLQNRLKLAAVGAVEAQNAYQGLFEIAQRSRVSFTELGGTFASISRSAKEYGVTQKELLKVTESVANAVRISGSSAAASQAALTQLSQGLASGVLRGEELNSVMEQTPRLARAIADGLGVPIGKLREMGAAGEITAKQVIEALKSQSDVLAGEVSDSVILLSQSFQQLSNSATNFVGVINDVTGATSTLSGAFARVTTVVDIFAESIRKTFAGNELGQAASQVLELDQRATQLRNRMANGFVFPGIEKELARVNRQLEEAKRNFRELSVIADNGGIDPRDQSQFKSRGQSYKEEAERQAKLRTDKDAFLARNSGVSASYLKDVQELIRLNQAGVLVGDEYVQALKRQQEQLYKGTGGSAKQANRDLEDQAQLLSKLSGLTTSFYKDWELLNRAYASGKISLDALTEAQSKLLAEQPFSRDIAKETAEAIRQQVAASNELARAEQDRINAAELSAASVEDQVQKLLDEEKALAISAAANISLAQAIEEVNIARLREQQTKLQANGGNEAQIQAIEREIEARRQLQQAIGRQEARKEAQEAADAAAKEWQKTADSIEATLTDALMRGFEGGKSFGENFAESLVNTFKTYVAKEIASSLSKALLSSFSGQSGGFNLGSLFGGGQGGGFNWGGLLENGFNYFTGGTSAAAAGSAYSLASGASSYGLTAGGTGFGVAAGGSGFGVTAGTAAAAGAGAAASGGAAGGASAGAMGAVPVVGWIAAAVMAADALYKRGYNREALRGVGESRDYKYSAENLARGLLDGLGFSEKWADILSGTVRMASLFGRRLKQEGYEVDIAGQNVDVEQYAYYKGGLFRSNKTVRGAADPDAVESLTFQVENVRESSKAMAQALGFSGDALDDFTGRMRINLKGAEDSAEAAKRYEEALIDLQRQMINSVTGLDYTKEEFAKFIEDINTSIQEAGISTSGIADIIVQGMLGELSRAQVGEQLANMVIGGIYNSIASPFASQIASVFTGQIIQPIFTAIAAGVPISQAISQQAIANVVQTAQQAAQQLNAIFADPSFRQAIAGVQEAISGIAGAATSVQAPAYKAAASSYNAAAEAAKRAAEEIRRAWQGITDSILEEMRRIRGEIVGNTEAGYSYTYAEFVSETARARAGSRKAAERLPELSQAVIDLAANQATSLSDLNVIRGQILASLAETRKIIAKQQGIAIPKFDVGTNYVPRDMLAMVHEGEAIIPKKYNPSAGGSGDNQTVQQLSVLNAQVEKLTMILREIENDTSRLDRNFDLVSQGGTSVLTEAA